MSSRVKSVLAVLLAGTLWGTISLFVKPMSAAGLGSLQISAVRLIVSAVLFSAVLAVRRPALLRIRLRDAWMFVGTGVVSVTLFNVCYFSTMIRSEASVAVVLLYTSPVFILLLSALLFRESITPRKWIALLLTVGGCACVAGLSGSSFRLPLAVLLTGIGSGLFYGLYTIFGRAALQRYDASTVTAYTFIFGALGSLPFARAGSLVSTVAAEPSLLLWCAGIGVCCTVLPYFLYTWGLERMESGKAAILVAIEPVVGAAIGMTVFHESRSAMKFVGICAVLAAIVLLNLPKQSGAPERG